jgi:dolichol-phosphate mannosyltransferase
MWREWGRSIDLKDATRPLRQVGDVALLLLVQGVPFPILLAAWFGAAIPLPIVAISGALFALRALVSLPMAHSYEKRGPLYWLSPVADPLAALRVLLSSIRRPRTWRGRRY